MEIGTIGKIIITNSLKDQIDFYHKTFKNKEWSGTLFFKHISGSFDTLTDLVFEATNIFLMDIGSGAFTNFENDSDIVKAYTCIGDDNLESLTGFCHSHHTMDAYFSGTDLQELKDNASAYNFYISLVVNIAEKYACKIVFPSEVASSFEYIIRDLNGNIKKVKKEATTKEYVQADLEVIMPEKHIPEWVKNRVKEVEEKKKAKQISKHLTSKPGISSYHNINKPYLLDNDYDWEQSWYDRFKEDKIISILGDKKFDNFVNSVLNIDTKPSKSISETIIEINTMDDKDWDFYLEALPFNVEIFYDNIYGEVGYPSFDIIFNKLIDFLKNQGTTERMKKLIEVLSEEWEVQ